MVWSVELVPYGDEAFILFPDEVVAEAGLQAGDEWDWQVEGRVLVLTKRTPGKAQ